MRREVLQLLLGLEVDHIARVRIARRLKRRKRAVWPRLAILLRLRVPIRPSVLESLHMKAEVRCASHTRTSELFLTP